VHSRSRLQVTCTSEKLTLASYITALSTDAMIRTPEKYEAELQENSPRRIGAKND